MARAWVICGRHPAATWDSDRRWRQIAARLTPDNIEVRPPHVARRDGAVSVVLDPNGATAAAGASVCLGATGPRSSAWAVPGAPVPDGSFAMWRVDSERIELVADTLGSRTIWYVQTDELFIAATSQRAIVMLLGNFEPSLEASAWMLSSGTLGPVAGWDERLRAVSPGGRVVLDRASWRVQQTSSSFEFGGARPSRDPRRQRRELAATVRDAVTSLRLDASRWALTLSGGVDCRGVLLALLEDSSAPRALRCVTWGRPNTLVERGNDGYVARLLAQHSGVSHRFLSTDVAEAPPLDRLLERFLVAGEGRVAHISGYLDGFALWKALRDEGFDGVIRGDQVFGRPAVGNAMDARGVVGLTVLEDYFTPRERAELELPRQELPLEIVRGAGETLATWRDRLCLQFRVPVLLAGLTDLKCAYVEVANPLLAGQIVRHVRTLADAERDGKRLWRQTVSEALPDIPFAKHAAIVPLTAFLATRPMLELMADELGAARTAARLPPALVHRCQLAVAAELAGRGRTASRWPTALAVPAARAVRFARRRLGLERPVLDPLVLAFRACIVTRMTALLGADATALSGDAAASSVPGAAARIA